MSNLDTTSRRGTLTWLRADDTVSTMVGEFYLREHVNPAYVVERRVNVIARRKGGRNKWNLCGQYRVISFVEGAGFSS